MNRSDIVYCFPSAPVVHGADPFKCFKPDFTALEPLYSVDGQPMNIIDNAENVPFLQNVAQQQLVDVMPDQLDTSGLSDKQLAASVIPRYAEISDLEDIANGNLRDMRKLQQESQI